MELQGLTDFQRDLMRTSQQIPREIPKILRKVGNKGRTTVRKMARSRVKKVTGMYHKKFKRGKVFKGDSGEWVVRVINSAPHAHLLEDGYMHDDGGFVRGKHVLKDGMDQFEASGDMDDMISDWLDDLLESNRL